MKVLWLIPLTIYVLLLAISLLATFMSEPWITYRHSSGYFVGIGGGVIRAGKLGFQPSVPGWSIQRSSHPDYMLWRLYLKSQATPTSGWNAGLSAWMPLALLTFTGGPMLYARIRSGPPSPSRCPKCRYVRAGLIEITVCPECGYAFADKAPKKVAGPDA